MDRKSEPERVLEAEMDGGIQRRDEIERQNVIEIQKQRVTVRVIFLYRLNRHAIPDPRNPDKEITKF